MELLVKGIYPPVITPLTGYESLDKDGVANVVEHLIEGGVHGLFLLGTNGEAPSLSYALRKEFLNIACEQIKGRVPILVAISDTSVASSLDMAGYCKDLGADGVVFTPPYYYPIDRDEMTGYLEYISSRLSLPFLLYNMPTHTKMNMDISVIKRAEELGAIGIKDSSGDLALLYDIIEEFRNSSGFSVFTGSELFLSETILNGGDGAVTGGANVFPRLFTKLYDASLKKDMSAIAKYRGQLVSMHQLMYNTGSSTARTTMSFKVALVEMGVIKSDYMALPLHQVSGRERELLVHNINKLIRSGVL